MSRGIAFVALGLLLSAGPVAAADTQFSQAQLEEMIAPIALYPDDVLSTVCIAATYPLEVVEADRWRKQNASLQGEALQKALEQQDWDPSVKSLINFPDVLDRMSQNLQWTQDLGDAFLSQRSQLMDAAQRLRAKAYDAGTLKTTSQQTVTRDAAQNTIVVQPANPQTVYVPTYAPATVYGPTYAPPPTPYYPSFWATPGGAVTAGVLGFGAGIATTALIGSAFNWHDHDVYVHNNYGGGGYHGGGYHGNANVNVNKNIDVNRTNVRAKGEKWQFNPEHRRGVRYRDPATAQKFQSRDRIANQQRVDRDAARGFDRSGGGKLGQPGAGQGANRPGGGQGAKQLGGGQLANRPGGDQGAKRQGGGGRGQAGNRPGLPGGGDRQARAQRPQAAKRPANKPAGAFGDAGGGRGSFDASRRGAASRGTKSVAGRGQQFGGGGGVARAGGGGYGGGGGAHRGGGGYGGGGGAHRGGGGGGRGGGGHRGGGRRH